MIRSSLILSVLCMFLLTSGQVVFKHRPYIVPESKQSGYGVNPGGNAYTNNIVHVTNLNDTGDGSFRDAVTNDSCIIVFDVSGIINSTSFINMTGRKNVTIYAEGITLWDSPLRLYDCENIILKGLKVLVTDTTEQQDGLLIWRSENIYVEHCSFLWSFDENLNINECDSVTVTYCVFAEGRHDSNDRVAHSYNFLGFDMDSVSVTHNIFAHSLQRNPSVWGDKLEFSNNVIYNWDDNDGCQITSYRLDNMQMNMRYNLYLGGPNSADSDADSQIVAIFDSLNHNSVLLYHGSTNQTLDVDGSTNVNLYRYYRKNADESTTAMAAIPDSFISATPIDMPTVTLYTDFDFLLDHLIKYAGCASDDTTVYRIKHEMKNRTGNIGFGQNDK